MDNLNQFMQARIEAMDREVRKYRRDREIIMSALARQMKRRNVPDGYDSNTDLAIVALNEEALYHPSELIKYNWSYESVQVQDYEH